ncbi:MAG TPA: SET domain-containing protein-lysine N-methyltransferase [Candidatus Paceibacterota bacterium]|nr:SET domain-containing protein-lysine N-methyltransferase [Candidatus Paceibacterota bacterium]
MIPRLKVKTARRKGRGVFANCSIRKREIVEVAPVIVVVSKDERRFKGLQLINYCYNWGYRGNQTALVLGFGCLYNHSYDPNVEHYGRPKRKEMVFRALRDISPGEELTHNYNGSPADRSPIRFTRNSWERM